MKCCAVAQSAQLMLGNDENCHRKWQSLWKVAWKKQNLISFQCKTKEKGLISVHLSTYFVVLSIWCCLCAECCVSGTLTALGTAFGCPRGCLILLIRDALPCSLSLLLHSLSWMSASIEIQWTSLEIPKGSISKCGCHWVTKGQGSDWGCHEIEIQYSQSVEDAREVEVFSSTE